MDTIKTQKERVHVLTRNDVEVLHTLLSLNYTLLQRMDPVEPPGIKSENMLESAVQRQFTGSGDWYKYENCFKNCATLIFGIIKNHPFHNGNKRTGLLCMIKHLYINGYVLKPDLIHQNIYDFIIAISDDKLREYANKHKKHKNWLKINRLQKEKFLNIDNQIEFIEHWLRTNSISKNVELKGKVKINKLKSILDAKGIKMEQNGAKIKVFKEAPIKILGIKTGMQRINEREYSLGNSLTEIGKATLKYLRRDFNLTPNDGIDNVVFYDDDCFLDEEITNYRKIIYNLSKT